MITAAEIAAYLAWDLNNKNVDIFLRVDTVAFNASNDDEKVVDLTASYIDPVTGKTEMKSFQFTVKEVRNG